MLVIIMKKIMIMLAVVALLLTACETRVIMQEGNEPVNAITVSGSSEFDVSPDIAVIMISVQTQNMDAKVAQDENRRLSNDVMSAVLKYVRKSDVETSNYNIYRVQEWERDRSVDKGFRVSNSFKVTTKQLGDVGAILDAAAQAGANNIDGINFLLSEQRTKEVRQEALKLAAEEASGKAKALADGLGVPLGKLLSVSESSYGVVPMPRMYDAMAMKAEMDEYAPTPVEPGSVHVSAQVSVSYNIGGIV